MAPTENWLLLGEAVASPYKKGATHEFFSMSWALVVEVFDFDDYEPDPISASKSTANRKINDLIEAIALGKRFHPIAATTNSGTTSNKPLKIIDGRHRAIAFAESGLDIVFQYHGMLSDATTALLRELGANGLTIQSSGLPSAAADFRR
jgi:hypothetical protein